LFQRLKGKGSLKGVHPPSVLNTILLLALAGVTTYWIVQWTSVRTPAEPLVAVPIGDRVARSEPIDAAAAARPFGGPQSSGVPLQAELSSRIRLEGVIAEGGQGKGVALISVDSRPTLAYRAGEAIDNSLVLMRVRADRVTIRSISGTIEVRMPELQTSPGNVPDR
jgi:hypothetical protein